VQEGRGQTQRSGWHASERKRPGEQRLCVTFTRRVECRTPGRSKALEPGPPVVCRVCLFGLPRRCIDAHRRIGWSGAPGVPDGRRASGCREAPRLAATGEALKAHEAYGWMWLETTATRVCRDQTAERVRNPESGRRWGGNPARNDRYISFRRKALNLGKVSSIPAVRRRTSTFGWTRSSPLVDGFVARPHDVVMTGSLVTLVVWLHFRVQQTSGGPFRWTAETQPAVTAPDRLRSLERPPMESRLAASPRPVTVERWSTTSVIACHVSPSESHPKGNLVKRRLALFGKPGRRLAEGRRRQVMVPAWCL